MPAIITNLEPITFELKPHLSAQMRDRLIVQRVPFAAHGYVGEVVENTLVISNAETKQPAKRGKPRASQSDADIQSSQDA